MSENKKQSRRENTENLVSNPQKSANPPQSQDKNSNYENNKNNNNNNNAKY